MLSTLPKRRKRPKMGCKESPVYRSERYKQWVRGHECAVAGRLDPCSGKIQSAHVRGGTDGGIGMDPSDWWTIPLCKHHHLDVQHNIGESAFEWRYQIKMKQLAAELWRKSPHRQKLARP